MLDVKQRLTQWRSLLEKNAKKELLTSLEEAPVVEVTDFLSEQPLSVCIDVFRKFNYSKQADIFCDFSTEKQLDIFYVVEMEHFANIFENMPSDLRADFYLDLDEREQVKLLPYLSKKVRKDVLMLSEYPRSKAGGIMNTDFVAVNEDATVATALDRIREEAPSKTMIYFIYIVNKERKLKGIVDLKDLVLAKPEEKVINLGIDTVIFANLHDDQEEVAHKIEKYDLLVLPILNAQEQLVGIVNYDDAIYVIRQEEKEDMEKFMGIMPMDSEDAYMDISSIHHFKNRIGWILALFLFGTFTTIIMHRFEKTIQLFTFLSFYLMTISDTGGNVGSQATTMVIRALSLGEINVKSWIKVLWKEMKVALMIALTLLPLCFFKVAFVSSLFHQEGQPAPYYIGLIVGIAVMLQVFASILVGALLPLLIKKLGKDPALATSPAITTIVDISGVFFYLVLAKLFWKAMSLNAYYECSKSL